MVVVWAAAMAAYLFVVFEVDCEVVDVLFQWLIFCWYYIGVIVWRDLFFIVSVGSLVFFLRLCATAGLSFWHLMLCFKSQCLLQRTRKHESCFQESQMT